ncbi:hypothetical protein UACE39S_05138 [Ureibacillus acetophenoni]
MKSTGIVRKLDVLRDALSYLVNYDIILALKKKNH